MPPCHKKIMYIYAFYMIYVAIYDKYNIIIFIIIIIFNGINNFVLLNIY